MTDKSTSNAAYPPRIGLIAGQGDFPILLANSAVSQGTEVIALCLNGFASSTLNDICTKTFWLELGQLAKAFEILKQENVTLLTMAGRVPHNSIFQYRHFDWRAVKLLARAANKKADVLLQTVCAEFEKEGIQVTDSSLFLKSLMPAPGMLTQARELTEDEIADIDFGLPIVNVIAGQDIGQTLVVKDKAVIAVEGLEGTDKCILRAGELAGPGCVIIKVVKPNQDLRFDIPVIGPTTIASMKSAGATALALSPFRSLIFHRDAVIAQAEQNGIALVVLPQ